MEAKTVLTGIKPTGAPHVGNYAGMIRPALSMVRRHPERRYLYFIADYHALTILRSAEEFRRLSCEVAASWLALGLDPQKVILYRQSDLPEVFELNWLLSCVTPKGLMNRAHAYKAAVAANRERGVAEEDAGINMGLYNYPVLMAADILLFQTDIVPVGEDQVQHVEIARDVAGRFNAAFGQVFRLPEHVVTQGVGTVPGLDGRKMSKSYGNVIPLFGPREELRALISRIQTDSSPPDAPKDPEASAIFTMYRQFADEEQVRAMRERYLAGISWADAKQALFEAMDGFLPGPRAAYDDLMAHTEKLDSILADGARRARALAAPLLQSARRAVGRT
jgi:tryptophanyl-tRNA synthetase